MRLVIVLSLASVAVAQTSSSGGGSAVARTGVFVSGSGLTFSSVGPGGAAMFGVTGLPYSAEQVTERVQTLADGTHITQAEETTQFYRDSQGRTRTEHTFRVPPGFPGSAPTMIEIMDPIAGVHYTLETEKHVAHKMTFPIAPPPPPSNSDVATARPVHTLPANASGDESLRPQFSHESLGSQTIEGILADGARSTVTYPIGAIGNDRPITVTTETWVSPELKVTVLSKNSDPRSGDRTTKLINISRAEPDPSLFQVPPDYEIVEPQSATPRQ